MVLSNHDHGKLSRQRIDDGLARGALVHCGFDNDAGGNKLWAQVQEAYPRAEAVVRERPPAGATDGNDALRATPGRAQGQGREDNRVPGLAWSHGGHDEHGRG